MAASTRLTLHVPSAPAVTTNVPPPLTSPILRAQSTTSAAGHDTASVTIPLDVIEDVAQREVVRAALCEVWNEREAAAIADDAMKKELSQLLLNLPPKTDPKEPMMQSMVAQDVEWNETQLRVHGCTPEDLPADRLATTVSFKGYVMGSGELESRQRLLHKINNILQGVYAGEHD